MSLSVVNIAAALKAVKGSKAARLGKGLLQCFPQCFSCGRSHSHGLGLEHQRPPGNNICISANILLVRL